MSKMVRAAAEGFKDSITLSKELVKGVAHMVRDFVSKGNDPNPPRDTSPSKLGPDLSERKSKR